MSNTRRFSDFNSPADGTANDQGTNEAGITLTDTLEDWREKTNGIIERINELGVEVVNIYSGQVDEHAINYSKIQEVNPKKLLGNTSSASGDVAEIEIDVTASGLQDSDVAIPTSKAVKDNVVTNQRYISGRINSNGTAASLHGITVSRVEAGVYNVIVADSHQLPSGESYSVIAQLGADLNPFVNAYNAINDSFSIHVFKIDDIGGDPAYRVEIFELESVSIHGGGNDNNAVANVDLDRRDAPFSVIGLPASAPS